MNAILREPIGSYTRIDTHSTIDVIENTLTGLHLTGQRRSGSKLTVWQLPDFKLHDGDSELTPTVMLRNAHKPGVAFSLLVGAFRAVCTNGLFIGHGAGGRLIHRTGPKLESALDSVPTMLHRTLEALTSTLQDTIDDAREVRVLDPVNIIGSLNLTKSRKDSLIYNLDQAGESTSDAWGLYNYINEVNRLRSRRWDSAWAADEGLLDDVKLLAQAQGGAT